jgi:hypothetical protein
VDNLSREGKIMAFREQRPSNRRPPLRPVERPLDIDVERARRTGPERASVLTNGAMTVGILSLIAGIAGFLSPFVSGSDPGLFTTKPGLLLGTFGINGMHAFVHVVVGILGIAMSRQLKNARTFLWIGGVVFALLGIAGFATDQPGLYALMGLTVNHADHWLHAGFAIVCFGILAYGSRPQGGAPA